MKSAEGIPLGESKVVLACEVYSRQANMIDVAITGMDMPGINSGPTVDRWTEPKDSLIAVSGLKKLFTSTQLPQTLKNLLDHEQAMNGGKT